LQSAEQQTPQEDYLKATPTVPEELYLQMPELLQHVAMAFTDERERDVFSQVHWQFLADVCPV